MKNLTIYYFIVSQVSLSPLILKPIGLTPVIRGGKAMKKRNELPDILTAYDIADYLGIGYNKALRLIRYGGIPHLKMNNTYRVSNERFFEWLDGETVREVKI